MNRKESLCDFFFVLYSSPFDSYRYDLFFQQIKRSQSSSTSNPTSQTESSDKNPSVIPSVSTVLKGRNMNLILF